MTTTHATLRKRESSLSTCKLVSLIRLRTLSATVPKGDQVRWHCRFSVRQDICVQHCRLPRPDLFVPKTKYSQCSNTHSSLLQQSAASSTLSARIDQPFSWGPRSKCQIRSATQEPGNRCPPLHQSFRFGPPTFGTTGYFLKCGTFFIYIFRVLFHDSIAAAFSAFSLLVGSFCPTLLPHEFHDSLVYPWMRRFPFTNQPLRNEFSR